MSMHFLKWLTRRFLNYKRVLSIYRFKTIFFFWGIYRRFLNLGGKFKESNEFSVRSPIIYK